MSINAAAFLRSSNLQKVFFHPKDLFWRKKAPKSLKLCFIMKPCFAFQFRINERDLKPELIF